MAFGGMPGMQGMGGMGQMGQQPMGGMPGMQMGGMAMGMNTNQPGMQRPMGSNPFDAFGGAPAQQPQPGAFGTAPQHQQ